MNISIQVKSSVVSSVRKLDINTQCRAVEKEDKGEKNRQKIQSNVPQYWWHYKVHQNRRGKD